MTGTGTPARYKPFVLVVLGLGLLAALGLTARGVAQTPRPRYVLAVRPHEMATGTRTEKAGEYKLDADPSSYLYIPPLCVGTRRCPLLVFTFSGGPYGPYRADRWLPPLADKYGIIVFSYHDWTRLDACLQEILRKFAIDPDRMAAGGYGGGGVNIYFGDGGVDIFSRVAPLSQVGSHDSLEVPQYTISGNPGDPPAPLPSKTTEFLVGDGFTESDYNWTTTRAFRHAGYRVTHLVELRAHVHQDEEFDFLGRWLMQSWAMPNPATRPHGEVVADPVPVLTVEAVSHMRQFWEWFVQAPDSILMTARMAHLREVALPIGNEGASTVMTDMRALAAQYPSVAAALTAAGLTAAQHEAYRVALCSAMFYRFANTGEQATKELAPVTASSVLGQNVAFVDAHWSEVWPKDSMDVYSGLSGAVRRNMWNTP